MRGGVFSWHRPLGWLVGVTSTSAERSYVSAAPITTDSGNVKLGMLVCAAEDGCELSPHVSAMERRLVRLKATKATSG